MNRNLPLRLMAAMALLLALGACGFTLRGVTPLPFDTLYINIPENTRFGSSLRRALQAASPGTKLVNSPNMASASLIEVSSSRSQREVSLTPQGRVEEYELVLTYVFKLTTAGGDILLPDTTLSASRDMPYEEQQVQAKQGEMETLFNSMEQSLVERLLRRLTAPDVSEAFEAYQKEVLLQEEADRQETRQRSRPGVDATMPQQREGSGASRPAQY